MRRCLAEWNVSSVLLCRLKREGLILASVFLFRYEQHNKRTGGE
jgi:hypothetical protein